MDFKSWTLGPIPENSWDTEAYYMDRGEDGKYYCALCLRGGIWESSTGQHCLGKEHTKNYKRVDEQQERIVAHCHILGSNILDVLQSNKQREDRISRLKSPRWIHLVESYYFQAIKYDRSCNLQRAEDAVDHFERIESLVILELAVWKACCLMQPIRFEVKAFTDVAEWLKKGWKQCKKSVRETGNIDTIMQNVCPFLK